MKKPGPRVLLVVVAAAAACFAVWLFPRESSVRETAPAKSRIRLAAALPAAAGASGNRTPVPEFGTEAYNKHILEHCRKWMESRNRDAGSLVALWDLTGDGSLLDEAAEKFP